MGLRPSCCQDGTLVPFSLMTNPAGLSLIISTHAHPHTLTQTHTHTYTHGLKVSQAFVEKGIEGHDDRELFLDTNFFSLREKKLQCKSKLFFICIDRSIYMLRGIPGNVQKQRTAVQVLGNVEKGCLLRSVFTGESIKDSISTSYILGNSTYCMFTYLPPLTH